MMLMVIRCEWLRFKQIHNHSQSKTRTDQFYTRFPVFESVSYFDRKSALSLKIDHMEHQIIQNVKTYWIFPSNANIHTNSNSNTNSGNDGDNQGGADNIHHNNSDVRGLLVLFHGCSHSGFSWFSLPEGRRVIKHSLYAGLAVVAFSSQDRSSKCWDNGWPPTEGKDVVAVVRALDEFVGRFHLQNMLLYALGASSGGSFVTLIDRVVQFRAAAVYISPGVQKGH